MSRRSRSIAIDLELHDQFKRWCSARGLSIKPYTETLIGNAMRTVKIKTIRKALEMPPPRTAKVPNYIPPISEGMRYPDEIYNRQPFWDDPGLESWGSQKGMILALANAQRELREISPTSQRYRKLCMLRQNLERKLGLTETTMPALNDQAEIRTNGKCSLCGIRGLTIDDICSTCEGRIINGADE